MRHPIVRRPKMLSSGDVAFRIPFSMARKNSEIALTLSLITNRRLFGVLYAGLQQDYFDHMHQNSGVFVRPVVTTKRISPQTNFPGDIDILVIPYEENFLILDRLLAIEVKIVRASFAKQGKSSNEFGVSQGKGLLDAGFPYAALIHLIVSDTSPREAWREVEVARIIDKDGRLEMLPETHIDLLPVDLIHRSFGRLLKQNPDNSLGLAAAYIDSPTKLETAKALWNPETLSASLNPHVKKAVLHNTASFFDNNVHLFLDIPRFDRP